MIYLAIDTSNKHTSFSIFRQDNFISNIVMYNFKHHLTWLHKSIKDNFSLLNIDFKDLHKIISIVGPGYFTATRVGVNISKTLSQILDIEIIPISSLEFMYKSFSLSNKIKKDLYYITLLDAKGKYVYYSVFKDNKKFKKEDIILIDKLKDIDIDLNKAVFLLFDNFYDKIKDKIKMDKFYIEDKYLYNPYAYKEFLDYPSLKWFDLKALYIKPGV